jgi:hypothetical protein
MEVCPRISIIDKRLITFLLQDNYVVFLTKLYAPNSKLFFKGVV